MISIEENRPPLKTRVKLFRVEHTDCGYYIKWESKGYRVSDCDRYSVKWVKGLTFENSHPTHWDYL